MSEYRDIISQYKEETLRQSMQQSVDKNPDKENLVQSLAKQYNMPEEAVRLQQPEIERRAKFDSMDYKSLVSDFKSTATFLADPRNASLSHDSVEELTAMEALYGVWKEGPSRTFTEAFTDPLRRGWAIGEKSLALNLDEAGVFTGLEKDRAAAAKAGGVNYDPLVERSVRYSSMQRDADRFSPPADLQASLDRLSRSKSFGEAFSAVLDDPRIVSDTLLQSIGMMGPTAPVQAVGAAAGPGGLMLSTFLTSGALEYGSFLDDAVVQSGGDPSNPQDVLRVLQDPAAMSAAREKAAKRGIAIGLFDAITAGLAGRLLKGAKPTGTSVALRSAGEAGVQAAGGAAGEATAQALTGEYKPGDILLEALAEIPTALYEVPSNYRDGQLYIRKRRDEAAQAEQSAQTVEQITQAAQASKLRERNPETFAQFVQTLTADGNTSSVYLNPQEAQDAGIDLVTLAGISPSVADQLQTALDSGQDIRIPLEELTTNIAGQEIEKQLIDHLKTDPKAMSRAQAQEFNQKQQELFQEEVKRVEAEKAVDKEWQKSVKAVEDDIVAQLKETGRFTSDVNKAFVVPYAGYAQVRAAQLGMTPLEFHQKYGMSVTGQMATDAAGFEQGGVDLTPSETAVPREANIGDTTIAYTVDAKGVSVDTVLTPEDKRGKGSARKAMESFLAQTDAAGLTTRLTAENIENGMDRDQLRDFYKSLGYRDVPGWGDVGVYKMERPPQRFSQSARGSDLLIQHNLSESNLLHASKMGGIPVPSLAVTKKDAPLTNFGEITLIGDPALADPKGYAATKVFGADIYSPRYPQVEYQVAQKAVNALDEQLIPYQKKYGGSLMYDPNQLKEGARNLENNNAVLGKFLEEKDIVVQPVLDENGKVDRYKTESALRRARQEAGLDAEYARYVKALFDSLGAKERIFQGFTYSGNRRYTEHNLDNVVKILKKELRGGENFNYGVGSLRAKFTPQFRSVEQIRKAKDRLVTRDRMEEIKKEIDAEFFALADELKPYYKYDRNAFGYYDTVTNVLGDAAKQGLSRALSEYGFENVPTEVLQKTAEFLNKLRDLPTEYFEAKVLRAVDLAEFKGAVVPEDTSEEALQALRDRGVTDIRFYKRGDDADRTAKVGEFNGLFFQSQQAPTFFSALQRAVESIQQPKGSAEQWAGILRNLTQKGVKQEEFDWTGVLDWIKEQQGSVTKEQILDYLKANEIKVEEVVKGQGETDAIDLGYEMRPSTDGGFDIVDTDRGVVVENHDTEAEARQALAELQEPYKARVDDTKFGKYTLPGGENYRELLMTLPQQGKIIYTEENLSVLSEEEARAEGFGDDGVARYWFVKSPDNLFQIARSKHKTPEAAVAYIIREKQPEAPADTNYTSSHYDEKNILAHIRFNERTDADGKRVLFIEEVQSDWHQAGRDKGYKINAKERARADELMKMADEAGGIDNLAPDLQTEARALGKRLVADGVPDAPFKTSWPELAFKRALMWAVENNFDRVAWTTGEQQAERYDLSKQVGKVAYNPDSQWLQAYGLDGKEILNKEGVAQQELGDYIGKEAAKNLLEAPKEMGYHVLSGDGLKVGGEGMKGFYDKMLPSMVNKLVKKWGGKVGQTTIAPEGARRIASSMNAEDRAAYFNDIKQRDGGEAVADVWALDITPAMRDSVMQGLPLFQQNRGSYNPRERMVRLLNAADLTTFLHEAAHYFLDIDTQIAALPNAPEELKRDVDTTLKWFGREEETPEARLAAWQSMTVEEQRPYHEQFAESFERYLFEGKAPSLAMREVFKRFSAWTKKVYRSLQNFLAQNPGAGKLNDEIRGVFDRMLATSEQIKEAEAAASMAPMFTDAQSAGMSEEQFKAYTEDDITAATDAVDALDRRSLRDMKWLSNAKGGALKALQADAESKRKAVRREVTDEVMAEPVNRARQFLKRGELNGEPVEGAHKLYIPEVEALYANNPAIGAITEKLGYGKYGMLAKDNGVHPDQVAEMFGFPSGRDLIDTLVSAEDPQEKIAALTDQRMLERYGDLTDPDAMERAAEQAIHNEARLRFVATELAALQNAMGNLNDINRAAKDAAASAVSQVKVKDLNPNTYIAAAARASREADKAFRKGDRAAAVAAKRRQLFNLAAAKEAFAAKADGEKALRSFRKLFRSDKQMSKYYDMKLVSAARAVLGAYGIGGQVNAVQAMEDLKKIKEYDPEMHAQIEPVVAMALVDAGDYRKLPYGEFKAMLDAVAQIAHAARRTKQIRVDGQLVSKKAVIAELRARLDEVGVPPMAGEEQAVTDAERRKWTLQGLVSAARRVESWVDAMDGDTPGKPFRKYIWQPVSEAVTQYRTAKNRVLKEYIRLLREKQQDFRPAKIAAPELGYTFRDKNELLGAMLHIGNGSNKRKLLLGRGWGEDKLNSLGEKYLDDSRFVGFLQRLIKEGTLNKSDFDFLQATWDLMESMKADAQKAHYDLYGYYFNEITAETIKTPFGEYRGGYAPAVADRELVQDAAIKQEANAVEEGFNFMMPSTSTGFTKGRTEYNKPLVMDLRLVAAHIDQALRFTYVQPAVRDTLRIVRSSGFANPVSQFNPSTVTDMLMPWLHRSARQIATEPFAGTAGKAVGSFLRTLRQRTGMVTMTANFVNAFQQVTGITMAAVKVKPRYLKAALFGYMKHPSQTVETIKALSPWMANRLDSELFELQRSLDDILEDSSLWQRARDLSSKHAYFAQRAFQNLVDVVTWQGAYDEALANGSTEKEAVRAADSAVRQTQGSQAPEDMARFESGNAFYQLFTQFTGYFNMQANLLGTEFKKAFKAAGVDKGKLAYVYVMGFMLPAVIADGIVRTFGWDWDDEDDDGYLDELMAWFFGSQLRTGVAMFPGVGNVANAAVSRFNDRVFDDRISTSPTVSTLESAVNAPFSVYKAVADDGKASRAVGDTLTLLTLTTGIPFSAVSRPARYLTDMSEGEVSPANAADFARGVISGRGREDERQ